MIDFVFNPHSKVLQQWLESASKNQESFLKAASQTWKNRAQEYAPVATGYMRSMILPFGLQIESIPGGTQARLGAYAPYSKYVEYGTPKMAAQPFARPAFRELLRTIVTIARRHLGFKK